MCCRKLKIILKTVHTGNGLILPDLKWPTEFRIFIKWTKFDHLNYSKYINNLYNTMFQQYFWLFPLYIVMYSEKPAVSVVLILSIFIYFLEPGYTVTSTLLHAVRMLDSCTQMVMIILQYVIISQGYMENWLPIWRSDLLARLTSDWGWLMKLLAV